jgi:hypothetical protein
MRPDMYQVIIERPRRGSRDKQRSKGYQRRWQKLAAENWPRRERIGALRGGTRGLNENLAPLRRYLQQQVGRPWDKVFAEICAHIALASAVQNHVRDHLEDFVDTRPMLVDGRLCAGTGGWGIGRPLGRGWKQFYVCTRTGLLRAVKLTRRRRRDMEPPRFPQAKLPSGGTCCQIDGVWYEVQLDRTCCAPADARDVVLHVLVGELGWGEARRAYGADVYAAAKRQLNKREIRRLVQSGGTAAR